MGNIKISEVIKKYTMVIALVVVTIFFATQKSGAILLPQNVTNLIAQNAYVFILATGMLFCILTGGNIDLSVGSVVCFVGAIGGQTVLNGVEGLSQESVSDEKKKEIYNAVAKAQLDAWKKGSGYFYWSYKLLTDTVNENGWVGWDSWDFGRCADFGWFPLEEKR